MRAGALCSRFASRRHSHALAPPVPRGRARPARSAAARRDACAPSATHARRRHACGWRASAHLPSERFQPKGRRRYIYDAIGDKPAFTGNETHTAQYFPDLWTSISTLYWASLADDNDVTARDAIAVIGTAIGLKDSYSALDKPVYNSLWGSINTLAQRSLEVIQKPQLPANLSILVQDGWVILKPSSELGDNVQVVMPKVGIGSLTMQRPSSDPAISDTLEATGFKRTATDILDADEQPITCKAFVNAAAEGEIALTSPLGKHLLPPSGAKMKAHFDSHVGVMPTTTHYDHTYFGWAPTALSSGTWTSTTGVEVMQSGVNIVDCGLIASGSNWTQRMRFGAFTFNKTPWQQIQYTTYFNFNPQDADVGWHTHWAREATPLWYVQATKPVDGTDLTFRHHNLNVASEPVSGLIVSAASPDGPWVERGSWDSTTPRTVHAGVHRIPDPPQFRQFPQGPIGA